MSKKFLQKIIVAFILGLFFLTPTKAKAIDVVVTTLPPTNVQDTSAIGNGSVSGTGITEKGIVWGLNPNPRTWDWGGKNKIMLPGGPGDISVPFVHNSPNTKLYFRVYAIVPGTSNGDDGDHWYGKDIMFSTTSGDVLTGDAKEIVDTEAILTGSVNPLGKKTSGYFRYSTMETPPIFCNDIYGSDMKSTFEEKLGAGDSPISFETKVTDLNAGTKYYYCTVGSNNGEIRYGGVKSFYTLGTPGESSITTKSALVENSTAAFLNGSFIAGTDSKTWFEYRKFNSDETNSWTKVNQESHKQNDTGDLKYELTNLTKGTQYEFRAAILDTSGVQEIKTKKIPKPVYGETLTFKTKDSGNIYPGPIGNGIPYEIPCDDPLDPNCNGTGGNIDPPIGNGRPDLVAGKVTPVYGKVSTPIVLMSLIRNQGNGPTVNGFSAFFQITLTKPDGGTNTTNNISLINKALAAETNTTFNQTIINLPALSMQPLIGKGVSVANQTYVFPAINTYYARACADKNSPSDPGVITESNEGNNCSPWTSIVISLDGTTPGGGVIIGPPVGGGSGGSGSGGGNQGGELIIGQTATPPIDAIVRYHEGIETVLQRQIVANPTLAKTYGYEEGGDINAFAWYLSDLFARIFGYVSDSGKEIRVTEPDIAAYQIVIVNGKLTIYEYYNSKIINIQQMTPSLRGIYGYEYYFRKR